jgi:hypothetical protein
LQERKSLTRGALRRAAGGAAIAPRARMTMPENRMARLRAQIETEFRELPGLTLTRWQAARLWSLDAAECEVVLKHLVAARVLRETRDAYVAGQIPAGRR